MNKDFLENDYKSVAGQWQVDSQRDNRFLVFTAISVVLAILLGIILNSLQIEPRDRRSQSEVPSRVARFIEEKQREKIPPPVPTPAPTPRPLPTPEPELASDDTIKKQREVRKPLSEREKAARERAEDSGLLALADQLADLQDVSDLMGQLNAGLDQNLSGGNAAVGIASGALDQGLGQGSGGIGRGEFGGPQVAKRQVALGESVPLEDKIVKKKKVVAKQAAGERTAQTVSRVFDKKKLGLYSLYNRERRTNPGLKGKLVLRLTISPQGKVVSISVLSSELNSPKLEQRILARVRRFDFGKQGTKPFTIDFPIEFLPS